MNLRRLSFTREVLQGLCLVLLMVIPCLLYARTLAFDFVNWDDDLYVYANPLIRSFSAEHVLSWFTRPFVSLYVPVPMISFALNFAVSGLDPGSYHAWNAVIHAANTLLVFFIFYFFQKDIYLCFLGALLFGVHPVQVEAVAWVSQRKTLLFAFFSLAGFYCFIRGYFLERKRRILFAGAALLFLLALLSKATAVMIPAVLFAFHHFYKDEPGAARRFVLPYLLALPFFAMAVFTLVLYPHAASQLLSLDLLGRVIPWAGAAAFYVNLIVHPAQLDLRYPEIMTMLGAGLPVWLWLGTVSGCLLLALLTWKRFKPAFWVYWFLLFLLPAAQVISTPLGDRHLYLPLAGFLGAVLALGAHRRVWTLAVLGLWAVFLIPQMSQRLEVWQNSETLWKSVRPQGAYRINAGVQLAGYYEEQGRFADAAEIYRDLISRRPFLPYPYLNAYNLYARLGRAEKAEEIAGLFKTQYSSAHELGDVYRTLLQLKSQPERVHAYLQEVMNASFFGASGERTSV